MSLAERIAALDSLAPGDRLSAVAALAADVRAALAAHTLGEATEPLRTRLRALVETDVGGGAQRLVVGELLGWVGDPRLRTPSESDYWVHLAPREGDAFQIGRFAVTNQEYARFVADGGYTRRDLWSEEGWAWLQGCKDPWPELVKGADVERYVVPNQPVVGVTHHEAQAYAAFHHARLPRWYERVFAVRGEGKRPYPWGSPFGEGNANTKEEVLGRPCAVGLYLADRTPEGICDLAGNTGEWTADTAGTEFLLHPGSWDQPSLASWAKACTTEGPTARWAALGFRLARD